MQTVRFDTGSQWKGHNVCEKDGKLTLIDLTLASESYDVGSISIKDQEFWVDNPEHVRKHPKMLDLFMFLNAVKDCCKSESSKYSQLQTQVSSFLCEKQGSVDENELYKEICNQLFEQLGVKRKERVSYEENASKHLLLHSIEPIEKARAAYLKDAEAGFGGPGLM